MKILFLVSSMEAGGAERVASLLSNGWAEQGHEVILMATFSGRGECAYELSDKVTLKFLSDLVGVKKRNVMTRMIRLVALRKFIKKCSPDVVLSFLTDVNVAAILASIGTKSRIIVSERTYPPSMPLSLPIRFLRKVTYSMADWVVMQTEQGATWLARECRKARVTVIPNPVVYPLPKSGPVIEPQRILQPGRRVVLSVGRLGKEKGHVDLIKAFALVAEKMPLWDLVILGEGPERPRLERLIAESKSGKRIFLPGRVGNAGDWYERAEMFVLSSNYEGFPNTLLEAMAHGLAAISYDCDTGPRDIIQNNTNGILVQPKAGVKGLSSAMESLMEDDAKRLRLACSAKNIRKLYEIHKINALWMRLMRCG